jgi:hypothetical protein
MKIQNAATSQATAGKKGGNPLVPKANKPSGRVQKASILQPATLGRIFLISLIVCVVTGIVRDRLSPSTWSVPLQYEGDTFEQLGWIKAASQFDYIPFASKINRRLGAPYDANWNDYPIYEEILTFVLGLAARWFGLMEASNLSIILSYLPSALAFYACCRMLKYRKLWSFVAAVLFGFTFYNSRRHIFHFVLAFSYVVPLCILTCWLILAAKRLPLGGRWFWFCVGVSLLMGLSNPYSLYMFLQLLSFSIVLNWWRDRDVTRLKVGLICIAAAAVGFISTNLDTLCYAYIHGNNSTAIPRNYAQTEISALKPMEMVVPPANHSSVVLASIGEKYAAVAPVKGELFSPYLGIVALIAFLWMVGEFIWRLLKRPPTWVGRIPAHTMQCVWILAYSVIGGVNNIFALGGLYLFRSANRYSLFISTICMFFFTARMSVLTRRWKPQTTWIVALVILLFGLLDELPRRTNHAETLALAAAVQNDAAFGEAIENALPKRAMVFQLPVMRFPEGGPVRGIQEYDMLRPYFHTKTLRFSYGSCQGRPREDWQFIAERLSPPEMVATLEKFGFSAIYINRKGYADRAEELVKKLADAGKSKVIEDGQRGQICVFLNPSPNPELPHTDENALIVYRRGWVAEERGTDQIRHWSGGNATALFFNELKSGSSYHITGIIASLSPRRVEVEFEGRSIWQREIGAGQGAPLDLWVTAKHRNNSLYFRTDSPASVPDGGGNLAVAFSAINLRAAKAPE